MTSPLNTTDTQLTGWTWLVSEIYALHSGYCTALHCTALPTFNTRYWMSTHDRHTDRQTYWSGRHWLQMRLKCWCMHSPVAAWITATANRERTVSVTAWWRSSRPSRTRQLVLWLVPGSMTTYTSTALPVRHRIDFKVAMTVFKCIHGLAPQYLADDCVLASTVRTAQSTTFAVRWHHETGGAADKDHHWHQGLCSRCCNCMEQTTSWHSNLNVHGWDIRQKLKTFYASQRIWGLFILRSRNWLVIIIIIIYSRNRPLFESMNVER